MAMQYAESSDEELIVRFREGELQIMDYLLNKYKNLVRKKAQSMFLLGGDTEDLIQEGMIGLFQAVMDYDSGRDASFYTFAQLCVNRKIYSAVKAANGKKHIPLNNYVSIYERTGSGDESREQDGNVIGELLQESAVPGPEDEVLLKEIQRSLEAAMEEELSSFEKDAFTLHLTGVSCKEVAGILGKDVKSTDNAIQRAKNKLRKALEKKQLLEGYINCR